MYYLSKKEFFLICIVMWHKAEMEVEKAEMEAGKAEMEAAGKGWSSLAILHLAN